MAWRQRDPAPERQWRERMVRWQASGLGIRQFCEQYRLTETSFYDWKRELQARDTAAASASARSSSGIQSPPLFVPLTVILAATLSNATLTVEVRCPSGHVVTLSACELSTLTALFAAWGPPAGESRSCRTVPLPPFILSVLGSDRHAEEF